MKILAMVPFLALAAVSSANLVVNGDFQSSTFSAPYQTLTGSQLPGWTIVGRDVAGIVSPYLNAPNQEIDLSGVTDATPGTTGISQTIATVAGRFYTLSFDVYAGSSFTGYNGGVDYMLNGNTVATNLQGSRSTFNFGFVATGSSTTLAFMSNNGNVSHIDNVSLSTPAPGAAIAFAVGAIRRRRRNR